MTRAVGFCHGVRPGIRLGSSFAPIALAAPELTGRHNGCGFLTSVGIGIEVGARLNLCASAYNGFDPPGVCSIFAATAIVGKTLQMN